MEATYLHWPFSALLEYCCDAKELSLFSFQRDTEDIYTAEVQLDFQSSWNFV